MNNPPRSSTVASAGAETTLSPRSRTVLELISEGWSYERIVHDHPDLTYLDIFRAAKEALALSARLQPKSARPIRMAEVKAKHARAYAAWSEDEEAQLRQFLEEGWTVARIAGTLQRQRSAIRSRMLRLGLVDLLNLKERQRFDRCQQRYAAEDHDDLPY